MALFNSYTPEGRQRFRDRQHADDKVFYDMWNSGKITFMEVLQDCNQGGSYLRYYYLNNDNNKYYEVIADANAKDTPFRQLQDNQIQEFIYTHISTDYKIFVYRCERKADYVYHFTLIR